MPLLAQDPPDGPVYIRVNQAQIKPGFMGAWRDLHRDTVERQRRGGMLWRLTQTESFGNRGSMSISVPVADFSVLDVDNNSPDSPAGMREEIRKQALESQRWFMLEFRQDLSIPGGDGVQGIRRMAHIVVKPGKAAEFEELWNEQIKPGMERSGMAGYQLFQTIWGGPVGEYYGGIYLPDYAALNGFNVFNALSQREQNQINERIGELLDVYEVSIVQVDRELSYGLPGLE